MPADGSPAAEAQAEKRAADRKRLDKQGRRLVLRFLGELAAAKIENAALEREALRWLMDEGQENR